MGIQPRLRACGNQNHHIARARCLMLLSSLTPYWASGGCVPAQMLDHMMRRDPLCGKRPVNVRGQRARIGKFHRPASIARFGHGLRLRRG